MKRAGAAFSEIFSGVFSARGFTVFSHGAGRLPWSHGDDCASACFIFIQAVDRTGRRRRRVRHKRNMRQRNSGVPRRRHARMHVRVAGVRRKRPRMRARRGQLAAEMRRRRRAASVDVFRAIELFPLRSCKPVRVVLPVIRKIVQLSRSQRVRRVNGDRIRSKPGGMQRAVRRRRRRIRRRRRREPIERRIRRQRK